MKKSLELKKGVNHRFVVSKERERGAREGGGRNPKGAAACSTQQQRVFCSTAVDKQLLVAWLGHPGLLTGSSSGHAGAWGSSDRPSWSAASQVDPNPAQRITAAFEGRATAGTGRKVRYLTCVVGYLLAGASVSIGPGQAQTRDRTVASFAV